MLRCLGGALAVFGVACGPGGYAGPAALPPPEGQSSPDGIPIVQPAPPPDTRNEGQVVVDLLAQGGYTCIAEESRWSCTSQSTGKWPVYVSYVPEQTGQVTIWFDSYEYRAFAQPCPRFVDALKDLRNEQDSFSVSCDDKGQMFRMNTALSYENLDPNAWMKNHESRRASAWKLLDSIGAVRK